MTGSGHTSGKLKSDRFDRTGDSGGVLARNRHGGRNGNQRNDVGLGRRATVNERKAPLRPVRRLYASDAGLLDGRRELLLPQQGRLPERRGRVASGQGRLQGALHPRALLSMGRLVDDDPGRCELPLFSQFPCAKPNIHLPRQARDRDKQSSSNTDRFAGDVPGFRNWVPDPEKFPSGLTNWLGEPLAMYAPQYASDNNWTT